MSPACVCQGCCDKVPHTEWPAERKCVVSSLEVGWLRPRPTAGSFRGSEGCGGESVRAPLRGLPGGPRRSFRCGFLPSSFYLVLRLCAPTSTSPVHQSARHLVGGPPRGLHFDLVTSAGTVCVSQSHSGVLGVSTFCAEIRFNP